MNNYIYSKNYILNLYKILFYVQSELTILTSKYKIFYMNSAIHIKLAMLNQKRLNFKKV